MKLAILSICMAFALQSSGQAKEAIHAFLDRHCIECHRVSESNGDRRFDNLPVRIESTNDLERYQEIVDQLNLGAMPPEDSPQPTVKQRRAVIAQLTEMIDNAYGELNLSGGHAVLRRLNSWEYRQTLGDLLGINVELWDPTEKFPREVTVGGLDNNGNSLVTSGTLMEHYFASAEEAIHRATQFQEKPQTRFYQQKSPFYFEGEEAKGLPKLFQTGRFRWIPKTPYTDLLGRHYRGGHLGFLPLFREGGVPHSGIYRVRVKAAALGRTHDYGKAISDFRNGDPLVLELAAVDRRGSVTSNGNVSKMKSLERIELTNEEPQWFQWDVHLDEGYEPEIRFRNGPIAAKRMVRLLTSVTPDKPEFQPFIDLEDKLQRARGVLAAYQGPRLRIWEIQVEGPYLEQWPSQGHHTLYGDLQPSDFNDQNLRTQLTQFALKAFRQPQVNAASTKPGTQKLLDALEPIVQLALRKMDQGMDPLKAYQLGCQAILCSPTFLYLDLGEGELADISLASRLSYFLWSSSPDAILLELAAKGKLRENLSEQVHRMLESPKADRFVQHFVRRWLDLDHIGEMPPSEDFIQYYRDNLGSAMLGETRRFFKHLLDTNQPPVELIKANYSFLNRELAIHYGIDGIEGNHLRLVEFTDGEVTRGGLLGQGSFLTASANGVDTSPVVRGVYVLEKLLGYTPPPPPPDVPAIEPDIRGTLTLRDQLEKHREIPTCNECHRKIDPLGFAFEHFDAIGHWRDQYSSRTPIDVSGRLPSGKSFHDFSQFKQLLIDQEAQINRCLAEKLMAYALGREIEIGDRPSIDAILRELQKSEGGLRDLITRIVMSDSFGTN